MKRLSFSITIIYFIVTSCSKKDDEPVVTPPEPIIFENNTAVPVPDGAGTTYLYGESNIVINQAGTIADASKVSIELDIAHTFSGDVAIELIAPNGDKCPLINRIYATEEFVTGNKLSFNSLNTALLIPVNGFFVTGNYLPSFGVGLTQDITPVSIQSVSLSTFLAGRNINGTWKLKMYDCAAIDVGSINSWKIKFTNGALQ
jgi:subtilisin-like proprotein convertase family protein